MEEIINIIGSYGMDAIIIALAINLATNIFKYPIKKLSKRLEPKGIDLTKYITLLPILFGFIFGVLATGLFLDKGTFWNARTPVLALSSGSLSLALYAVFEKFTGKGGKQGSEVIKEEIQTVKAALEKLQSLQGVGPDEEQPLSPDVVGEAGGSEARKGTDTETPKLFVLGCAKSKTAGEGEAED